APRPPGGTPGPVSCHPGKSPRRAGRSARGTGPARRVRRARGQRRGSVRSSSTLDLLAARRVPARSALRPALDLRPHARLRDCGARAILRVRIILPVGFAGHASRGTGFFFVRLLMLPPAPSDPDRTLNEKPAAAVFSRG